MSNDETRDNRDEKLMLAVDKHTDGKLSDLELVEAVECWRHSPAALASVPVPTDTKELIARGREALENGLLDHPDPYTLIVDLVAALESQQGNTTPSSDAPKCEYATTTGPRKAWYDENTPPPGDGWELDPDRGRPGESWDRFDYHEERYWRRPLPVPTDKEDDK